MVFGEHTKRRPQDGIMKENTSRKIRVGRIHNSGRGRIKTLAKIMRSLEAYLKKRECVG